MEMYAVSGTGVHAIRDAQAKTTKRLSRMVSPPPKVTHSDCVWTLRAICERYWPLRFRACHSHGGWPR